MSERVFTVNTGIDDYVDDESDDSRDDGTDEGDGSGVTFEYDEDTESGSSDLSAFTRCDECGRVHVTGATHSCEAGSTDASRPTANTRDGREALIELDRRDEDETVLFLRGRSDSSYHEFRLEFDLDAMLASPTTPENCPAEPQFRTFEREPRGYVQDTGRPPCLYCHPNVRRRRDEGENPIGK